MATAIRVVCLGGGYVSIYLMREMRRAIQQGLVEVFVIDRNNYHTFHGLVPEMLSGKIQPGQVISPSRRLFKDADFHNAEIIQVDAGRKVVVLERILDRRTYELPYDHLVIGLGSRSDLSRYRGVAEHAMQLKTYWDCYQVRNHVLKMLEMADDETDPLIRQRLLTFVVAGGNYAGIETVAELTEFLRVVAQREYPQIDANEVKVVLVHSRDRILPELDERFPKLTTYAQEYLSKQPNLELKLNTRMKSATINEVILSTGEAIPTRTIISCTGTAQSPLLDQMTAERDTDARVVTDKYGRVQGMENTWAGGDCAAVPHPDGGTSPPLAMYAMTAGAMIGKNISRIARGQDLQPYRFAGLGDACVLGMYQAVGHFQGVQYTGFMAWLSWRVFMIYYLPTWDRRLRTMTDWLIGPIVGRDIVSVTPTMPRGADRRIFEDGQIIQHKGRPNTAMYAVRSGQVAIFDPDSDELVMTLKAGDHFGGYEVLENIPNRHSARAVGAVNLLAIPREQTLYLSDTISAFSDAIKDAEA